MRKLHSSHPKHTENLLSYHWVLDYAVSVICDEMQLESNTARLVVSDAAKSSHMTWDPSILAWLTSFVHSGFCS